ncbi:cysteine dioxygenase, partial [Rhodococcus rhodochrous KG-21]
AVVYAPALTVMSRYRIDDVVLRLRASERAGANW